MKGHSMKTFLTYGTLYEWLALEGRSRLLIDCGEVYASDWHAAEREALKIGHIVIGEAYAPTRTPQGR